MYFNSKNSLLNPQIGVKKLFQLVNKTGQPYLFEEKFSGENLISSE